MGVEKEHEPPKTEPDVCVVEATDANGSVVGRDAFPTQAACDAHAAAMRAKGYTVTQSSLAPK